MEYLDDSVIVQVIGFYATWWHRYESGVPEGSWGQRLSQLPSGLFVKRELTMAKAGSVLIWLRQLFFGVIVYGIWFVVTTAPSSASSQETSKCSPVLHAKGIPIICLNMHIYDQLASLDSGKD